MNVLESRNLANRLGVVAMQAGIRDEEELMRYIRRGVMVEHRIPIVVDMLDEIHQGRIVKAWLLDAKWVLEAIIR